MNVINPTRHQRVKFVRFVVNGFALNVSTGNIWQKYKLRTTYVSIVLKGGLIMAVAAAQLKEQPMSFDDMLTQTAKPKAKAKAKSKMPTLDTSDAIVRWIAIGW